MLQRLVEFLRGGAFSQAMAHQEAVQEVHRQYFLRHAMGFARTMGKVKGKAISVGIHKESGREVLAQLSLQDVLAHELVAGRSGSGKSRYVESLIVQFLRSFPEVGIIIVDGKGELFDRVWMWIA